MSRMASSLRPRQEIQIKILIWCSNHAKQNNKRNKNHKLDRNTRVHWQECIGRILFPTQNRYRHRPHHACYNIHQNLKIRESNTYLESLRMPKQTCTGTYVTVHSSIYPHWIIHYIPTTVTSKNTKLRQRCVQPTVLSLLNYGEAETVSVPEMWEAASSFAIST